LLAVCDHRAAAPHARLRWGDHTASLEGSASDVLRFAEQRARELDQLAQRVAAATNLTAPELLDRFARRRYLDLEEARALGVLDEVLAPEARVLRLPRHVGFKP
jgi:ATP-dependent protease ClpP protease subunit